MKTILLITTLFILVSCGSKGNKENHGSGVTVTPWCSNTYISERNQLVSDINLKLSVWRWSTRLGTPVDREEFEDLLADTVKFLNTHENTVCRGEVMNTCDVLADPGCRFTFTEQDINNSELVKLRKKMVEILVGN